MTVSIRPETSYERPRTSGSAPNQLFHSQSLSTITSPAGSSSVGRRPACTRAPSVENRSEVTCVMKSRSNRSSARTVVWADAYIPMSSSMSALSRYWM